jgi:hypothetical protein
MKNEPIRTKIFIIFGIFVSIVLVISLIWWFINKDKTATLEILVTPSSSNILIDNKTYSNGIYKIKPGEYKVDISKAGFDYYSGNIITRKDQTVKLYIALLQSDGSYSWYLDHQQDDVILSAIGSKEADETQQNLTSKYPILQYIPYTDSSNGNNYKIDVQMNNNNLEYLTIFFNTCSSDSIDLYKIEALAWIKSKNINPDDYTIKYTNLCD